jgi:hypothetical protein
MGENSNGSSWQAKDILVAMPVLASSLAVSWEVGRMIPFGGFSFFTLSEHLLSALKALPVAFLVAVQLVLVLGLINVAINHRPKKSGWTFLGILAMMSASLILIHYLGWGWTEVVYAVVFDIVILGFIANAFWFRMPFSGTAGILVTFGAAIAGAMILADNASTLIVERAKVNDATVLSTVTYKNGNKKLALLVMSGERGLLLYDAGTNKVTFELLDDVKTVEWNR